MVVLEFFVCLQQETAKLYLKRITNLQYIGKMETTLTLISTIATAVSAVIATGALLLALHNYREKTKTEHAERMLDLLAKIRKDKDVTEFFRHIDFSNGGWYDDNFHNGEFEKTADNTLLQFEYILYLKEQNLLTEEEFKHYVYEIEKIVNDRDIQKYFFNLYHYCNRVQLLFKFEKLMRYGIDKHYIDKDIYNKESVNYGKKQLNF